MTIWRQLGLQLGQVWKHPGAKLGPTRADSAASMQHAENVRFYLCFQRFGFVGVKPCCPHWACLGPNFGARRRTKLRMLSPTCAQTFSSCAMLDPVGLKLGPSWSQLAQVRPKLGASELLFGPT